jgi:hypothetical protein
MVYTVFECDKDYEDKVKQVRETENASRSLMREKFVPGRGTTRGVKGC